MAWTWTWSPELGFEPGASRTRLCSGCRVPVVKRRLGCFAIEIWEPPNRSRFPFLGMALRRDNFVQKLSFFASKLSKPSFTYESFWYPAIFAARCLGYFEIAMEKVSPFSRRDNYLDVSLSWEDCDVTDLFRCPFLGFGRGLISWRQSSSSQSPC